MKANFLLLISKQDAIKAKLPRYFTGLECKRGHIAERRTSSMDCVECSKIRQRTEKVRQYKQKNYQTTKETILVRSKKHYEDNRDKKIAYAIDYQRKHAKKIYQRNKIALKQKINESPWIVLHLRLKAGIGSAIKKVGSIKKSKTMDLVGCSLTEFKEHIEKQFLSGMTRENREKWHIDHITPISLAKSENEVIALYHFTNLRPMWAKDNIRKSNKEMFLV